MRLPPPFVRKHTPKQSEEPIPRPHVVARWSDDYLAERLARGQTHPYTRIVLESELRVREAWRSPDSWAFVVALVSLVVSVAALVVSAR